MKFYVAAVEGPEQNHLILSITIDNESQGV